MALTLGDRVKETTTVTGTGTATLLGATTGFQSFAVVGNGNTTYYCIADQGGANWEVGIGTYTASGTTLARTTVLASSNTGSLVVFTAGVKDVFVTYPAEKGVWYDASGNATITGTTTTTNLAYTGTLTGSTGVLNIGSGQVYKDASGNVGIGTASPTQKLDVTGNINTSGSLNSINTFAYKNLLIDAGFIINQRAYVSAATLASGAYGHDRWKAGASGGDYSFTQLASNTQITIASGKSLIQVVEDKNVNGTSYVLSWTGTAQARYAVNSATPSGSYAASPIVITGQTAGTTMSVEFNTGTLSKPQLELGAVATSFDYRPYGTELALCQRYYTVLGNEATANVFLSGFINTYGSYPFNLSFFTNVLTLPVKMRATPTGTVVGSWIGVNVSGPTIPYLSTQTVVVYATGTIVGQGTLYNSSSAAYLSFSSEL